MNPLCVFHLMITCTNNIIVQRIVYHRPIESYKRFMSASRVSPRAVEKCSRAMKKKKIKKWN